MTVPFFDPKDATIANWLKSNIENEWKLDGFQLSLEWVQEKQADRRSVPITMSFAPGVTAQAGATSIRMDSNQPLDGAFSRWTIRHEFGHTLGFPDCFVEFFDGETMISYPIDATNLMCWRGGHVQQQHFEKLKEKYEGSTVTPSLPSVP